MEYIRNYYGVPLRRGLRVRVNGKLGVITGASSAQAHVNVRFDGQKHSIPCHPTWRFEYLVTCPHCRTEQPLTLHGRGLTSISMHPGPNKIPGILCCDGSEMLVVV